MPIPSRNAMLSSLDRSILDFERGWWLYPEPKDRTIAEVVGVDPAHYYRRLRELAGSPAAWAYDPLTVGRVRRIMALGGT